MRKIVLLNIFAAFFFSIALPVNSAVIIPSKEIVLPGDTYKKVTSLKIKDVQKMIGRKLTLKEKISFLILRHQLKQKADSKKSLSKTALTLGFIAVVLLIGGLFLPPLLIGSLIGGILSLVLGTLARKDDHSDKKAQAAILLGWITLGLLALLLLVIVIILASWSWY